MSLEAFQSGLSWLIILRKRDNFRRAFDGFDIEQGRPLHRRATSQRLMADDGIVRNRAKIEATIANARAAADLGRRRTCPSCCGRSRRRRGPGPPTCPKSRRSTAESKAMAKELKRRGFRFVGPTTAYALMQATGMVDDHVASCWVPADGCLRGSLHVEADQSHSGSLHTDAPIGNNRE